MIKINVMPGDIAAVKADALITAINSGGMWFGGIDGVISRLDNSFHAQAANRNGTVGLNDGDAFAVKGCGRTNFENVVFVVDDLKRPLNEIVLAGLSTAAQEGFKSVTLPTIRMGVMLGVVEKTPMVAVAEMLMGVQKAIRQGTAPESITFVVYNDARTEALIKDAMASIAT